MKNMLSPPEMVIKSSRVLRRSTLPFRSRFLCLCIFQRQAWLSMQETLACSYIPQSYQQERGLTLALQVWTKKRGGCPWPFRSGPTREAAAPGPSGLDQQERRLPWPFRSGPGRNWSMSGWAWSGHSAPLSLRQFIFHVPQGVHGLLSRGSNHESLNPSVIQSTEGMRSQDLLSVSNSFILLAAQRFPLQYQPTGGWARPKDSRHCHADFPKVTCSRIYS